MNYKEEEIDRYYLSKPSQEEQHEAELQGIITEFKNTAFYSNTDQHTIQLMLAEIILNQRKENNGKQ
tara:strand:+ start:2800 stop:3000 length:201 start_codon:yes stop_codon:yes gene_type:complete